MTSTAKLGTMMALLLAAGCSSKSQSDTPSSEDSGATEEAATPDASDDADDTGSGCVYPSGPYGITAGKVLDPSLTWQGYLPNATTSSTIKIGDLYDCDGSKGINAILIDTAGQWCIACQGVAQQIPTWLSATGDNYTGLGVKILNLIIENNAYEPATITTAEQWRTQWSLSAIYVTADPNISFPTNALPNEILVDPRTMKVSRLLSADEDQTNDDGSDPYVAALAKKNGGK